MGKSNGKKIGIKKLLFGNENYITLAKISNLVVNIILLIGIVTIALSLVYRFDCGYVTKSVQLAVVGIICLVIGFGYKFWMKKMGTKLEKK